MGFILLYSFVVLILGFLIGRFRYYHVSGYQNQGESRLSSSLKAAFANANYHLLNHITLEVPGGTTQIDHILVSRFGIFVLETKDYKGWIFANGNQSQWTQVLYHYKFKLQNPIHQNFGHVRAVQVLLDFMPPENIKSAVVFTGEAEFKTPVPNGVYGIEGVIDFIRGHSTEIMTANRMQFCVGRIETARMAVTGQTDVDHVENLHRRYRRFN